nr:hypothetical protein [Streptomyces sp. CC228A]
MPDNDLRRSTAFLTAFARRAAERTADLPGAFAATYLAMRHTGPVPAGGGAEGVPLDVLREPLARVWRADLPAVGDDVVRDLVERRAARLRGAPAVRFLASPTPGETRPPGPTCTSTRRPVWRRSRTSSPTGRTAAAATRPRSSARRCARPRTRAPPPGS